MTLSLRGCATGAALLLLPSCAVNSVRLDRAVTMGQAGAAATDSSRRVMNDVQVANGQVLVGLAAIDPHCALPEPTIRGGASRPGELLCVTGMAGPGDFPIERWRARDFAPSLAVIRGISAYLGEVDAIVSRKLRDLSAEFTEAEATLRALSSDLGTIAGVPVLPDLTSDQRDAISKALALIGEIVDEQGRVRDLKRFERAQDPAAFDQAIAALGTVDRSAVNALSGQLMHQQTLLVLALRRMPDAPIAVRQSVAEQLMAVINRREAIPELRNALDTLVKAFADSHRAYLALLNDSNAPLTKAERRKIASVMRQRVLGAVSAVASIVKAF